MKNLLRYYVCNFCNVEFSTLMNYAENKRFCSPKCAFGIKTKAMLLKEQTLKFKYPNKIEKCLKN